MRKKKQPSGGEIGMMTTGGEKAGSMDWTQVWNDDNHFQLNMCMTSIAGSKALASGS